MSNEHTVGPWAVNWAGSGRDGQFVYDEVYVYSPACGVEDIAVAADIADPLTGKPSPANGRLIAAAPDLLAVLQTIVRVADGRTISGNLILDENSPLMDAARDVIAKATSTLPGTAA